MSRSPDYETPGESMGDAELSTNIECLLQGWFDSCDREELLDLHTYLGGAKMVHIKHECFDCGEMIHKEECHQHAPDFLCEACHLQRYYEDSEYREETDQRRAVDSIVELDQEPMKHSCPDCGEMITKDECPKEAPDFVCEPCHLERYKNIPAWREETDQRRNAE